MAGEFPGIFSPPRIALIIYIDGEKIELICAFLAQIKFSVSP
jgi:hypothetical protein